MASESILDGVVDFLKKYPPFYHFSQQELKSLAQQTALHYFEKDEVIFEEKKIALPHFFVIKKGSVGISQQKELIDQCDEGDLFGVRAFLAKDSYLSTATALENSLLLSIPSAFFVEMMSKNSQVALFFAAGFASGINSSDDNRTQKTRNYLSKNQGIDADVLAVDYSQKIITANPELSIRQAAQLMKLHRIGSLVVVNEQNFPVGIVTDTDFRNKVVANEENIQDHALKSIMSSPVKTIVANLSVSQIMLLMISNRVSHFCVTADGTAQSKILGVVSQRDLMVWQGNNPAILAKEILKSKNVHELLAIRNKVENLLVDYIDQDFSVPYILHIVTHINDLLIDKAVDFAERKLEAQGFEKPKVSFCWLSMGSEGRKEQILRTDLDNALIYEDSTDPNTGIYFLELAKYVNESLIACGFEKCPADMMASNPKWCLSQSSWQQLFGDWIQKPTHENLLSSSIFFDFRPVYGNFVLAENLKRFVVEQIAANPIFLNFLAKNALQNPPPLSFFRKFVVEKSGQHKDHFDLKARAMMPLADAARLLAYQAGLLTFDSTSERFEKIAQKDPNLQDLADACAMAYEILLKIRAKNGFTHHDSGRYIDAEKLNKLERQSLRNIFTSISKIQQVLEVRFQLAYLS